MQRLSARFLYGKEAEHMDREREAALAVMEQVNRVILGKENVSGRRAHSAGGYSRSGKNDHGSGIFKDHGTGISKDPVYAGCSAFGSDGVFNLSERRGEVCLPAGQCFLQSAPRR